jgi:hypothetical protein
MRTRILGVIAAIGSFAFFGVASPAADVNIAGVGSWGDGTPDTPFSQPGAPFAFTFDLPNPIPSNPTNRVTNFSYILNSVEVSDTLFSPFVTVEFFTADDAGMFDLIFQNGDVVSLYGADIGTSLTFAPGVHFAAAGMQMEPASGIATVIVRVATGDVGVTGFGAGGVPESSTRVMMTLGFAGLAFAGYRASHRKREHWLPKSISAVWTRGSELGRCRAGTYQGPGGLSIFIVRRSAATQSGAATSRYGRPATLNDRLGTRISGAVGKHRDGDPRELLIV